MVMTIVVITMFNYTGTLNYPCMRPRMAVYYRSTVNNMCTIYHPGMIIVAYYHVPGAAVAGVGITVVREIGIWSWAVYSHFITGGDIITSVAGRQSGPSNPGTAI